MTLDQVVLADLPQRFCVLLDKEFMRWEAYAPTTIDKDIPFKDHWWKYVYWIPRIKKEFYVLAISAPETAIEGKILDLGMDEEYFRRNYREFFKRLEWMRKNNKFNHLGEL